MNSSNQEWLGNPKKIVVTWRISWKGVGDAAGGRRAAPSRGSEKNHGFLLHN